MTPSNSTARRRSSSRTRRRTPRRQRSGESVTGRLIRTLLTGLVLAVVLLIAASYLGLLGQSDLPGAGEEGAEGPRVYQTLVADPDDPLIPAPANEDPLWRPLRHDAQRRDAAAETRAANDGQMRAGGVDADGSPAQSEDGAQAGEDCSADAQQPPGATAARRGDTHGRPGATSTQRHDAHDRGPTAEPYGHDAPAPPPTARSFDPPVRVHLANGCGVNRLAARMRERFRAAGFDVCGVDNADRNDYGETLVVDRCGDAQRADAVRAFLQEGWHVGRLVRQVRRAPMSDVLVVLGRDLAASLEPADAP
ncbi:MAG: hypothetical protein GF330_02525 [Candidatus Eisenbacteria bacterium]|nr:hypothetical protein [Candidatus Eisenbacteria bacterium]